MEKEVKKVAIILDPAHGINVKGKCSPDGTHKEYIWSRQVCNSIGDALKALGYSVYWTNESDKEIGLTNRKNVADKLKVTEKYKLLISSHNNAAGDGTKWMPASGVEIFTTKGNTLSDKLVSIMYEDGFKPLLRDMVKVRADNSDGDMDKEENFTVLTGATYSAMLIEWLFQDSRVDIEKLKDPAWNSIYVKAVVNGVEAINTYLENK